MYNTLGERTDSDNVELSITYLEIYQNAAFDLLNAASGASARLPKISVIERPATSSGANVTVITHTIITLATV